MMQIAEITLYGYNGKVRHLPFDLGKVNIVTGRSKTGKSVIGDIVEYCLGGGACNIAEGIVRRSVAWYGLLLQFGNEQMFVARKNPDPGFQSSTYFYYEIGEKIDVPKCGDFISNSNVDTIEEILSARVGIQENLNIPPTRQTREALSANVRHALFYCFQKQVEVASNVLLFHRQGEPFMTQTIKDTLPYFFGIIDNNFLALVNEQQTLKRKIAIEKRNLSEIQAIQGGGLTRALSLILEAQNAGMLSQSIDHSELDARKAIEILQKVTSWQPNVVADADTDRLTALQSGCEEIIQTIRQVKDDISIAEQYIGAETGYSNEVQEQKLRLESIGLFENLDFDPNNCPLCSSPLSEILPDAVAIRKAIADLNNSIQHVEREKPKLVRYIIDRKVALQKLYEKRQRSEIEINGILRQSDESKLMKDRNSRCAKIIGRISLWIESVEIPSDTTDLLQSIASMETRLEEINSLLSQEAVEERLQSILSRIAVDMSQWAKTLQLEHCEYPYRLDLKKLTVVVDMDRPVPLQQLGSGSNWVGIHLITYFALHKYFVSMNRPIPRFLFIDQPSQVYFPSDEDALNTDKIEVNRLYDFIFKQTEELKGQFQVIIVDHANLSSKEFKTAVVQDWWHGDKLIPDDWIGNGKQN